MATVLNLVFMPCLLGPTLVSTSVPFGGASARVIRVEPFNLSTGDAGAGSSVPTGPQWWPLTG